MKFCLMELILVGLVASRGELVAAEPGPQIEITMERLEAETGFAFERVPFPATNDAGEKAVWKLIDGEIDANSPGLSQLHNGRVPAGEDEPNGNFFLRAGAGGGTLIVDLGKVISLSRISSYSRHTDNRASQVYTLYGSSGEHGLPSVEWRRNQNLEEHGWNRIAKVDTRRAEEIPGGTYGVSIQDTEQHAGPFRFLLFVIEPTQTLDDFSQTFFSEIDIVAHDGPELEFVAAQKKVQQFTFATDDGKYAFHFDVTDATDLTLWSQKELVPVIKEWYPKIVEMLSQDSYPAATVVKIRYRNDLPDNIPAMAAGTRISLNALWFREHLQDEAKGCVVHEMVHVVQDYGSSDRGKETGVPAWFSEGIADYVRWFRYEPESQGAKLSQEQLREAKHDASYRTSAHFIDWAMRTQDESLVKKMNVAAHDGKYDDSLWEIITRKRLVDLADEWRMGE